MDFLTVLRRSTDVSKFLLQHGYSRTTADPCMFFKRLSDGKFIVMVVHVDDFAIASSHKESMDEVFEILRKRYTITTADSLESYLCIHIEYFSDGNVRFTQRARIQELVKECNLAGVKPASVPMSSLFNVEQDDSPRCDQNKFLSLLGELIFIIKTRRDAVRKNDQPCQGVDLVRGGPGCCDPVRIK
jgi:hypothetical protein